MTDTDNVRLLGERTRNHVSQVKGSLRILEGFAPWLLLTTHQSVREAKAVLSKGAEGAALFCYPAIEHTDIGALEEKTA